MTAAREYLGLNCTIPTQIAILPLLIRLLAAVVRAVSSAPLSTAFAHRDSKSTYRKQQLQIKPPKLPALPGVRATANSSPSAETVPHSKSSTACSRLPTSLNSQRSPFSHLV